MELLIGDAEVWSRRMRSEYYFYSVIISDPIIGSFLNVDESFRMSFEFK